MKRLFILLAFILAVGVVNATPSALNDATLIFYSSDSADTSGTTAIDRVGTSNGTINGATTGAVGKINQAYSYDGTDDFLATNYDYPHTDAFTVSAWVYLANTGVNGMIYAKSDASISTSANIETEFVYSSVGTDFSCSWRDSAEHAARSTTTPAVNTWYFVTCVVDNAGGRTEIYVNGVSEATNTATGTRNNKGNALIGKRADGFADFNGRIDEFYLFNKALNDTEVSELYNLTNTNEQYLLTGATSTELSLSASIPKRHRGTATITGSTAISANFTINTSSGYTDTIANEATSFTYEYNLSSKDTITIKATDSVNASNTNSSSGITYYYLESDSSPSIMIDTPYDQLDTSFTTAISRLEEFVATTSSQGHQTGPGYHLDGSGGYYDSRDSWHQLRGGFYARENATWLRSAYQRIVDEEYLDNGTGTVTGTNDVHWSIWWLPSIADYAYWSGDEAWVVDNQNAIYLAFTALYDGFDTNNNDLIEFRDTHWVYNVGEPDKYVTCTSNYCSESIVHNLHAAYALKLLENVSAKYNLTQKDYYSSQLDNVTNAIETIFWNESESYYYVENDLDAGIKRFSANSENEASRITDMLGYGCRYDILNKTRCDSVSAYYSSMIENGTHPGPLTYPTTGFSSAYWFITNTKAWQGPYERGTAMLSHEGYLNQTYTAVKAMADTVDDANDLREWYNSDGTEASCGFSPSARCKYTATAGAHITATIESLFGIHPASTGFETVNIRPMTPLNWSTASINYTLPLGRYGFNYTLNRSGDTVNLSITTAQNHTGLFRIPVNSSKTVSSVTLDGASHDYVVEDLQGYRYVLTNATLTESSTNTLSVSTSETTENITSVNLTVNDTSILTGGSITYNLTPVPSNATSVTYQIDFDDGSSNATSADGTHTYSSAGTYTLSVDATDGQGNVVSNSTTITVTNPTEELNATINAWDLIGLYYVDAGASLDLVLEANLSATNPSGSEADVYIDLPLNLSSTGLTWYTGDVVNRTYYTNESALDSADGTNYTWNGTELTINLTSAPSENYTYVLDVHYDLNNTDIYLVSINDREYTYNNAAKAWDPPDWVKFQLNNSHIVFEPGETFPFVEGINNITVGHPCFAEVCAAVYESITMDMIVLREFGSEEVTINNTDGNTTRFSKTLSGGASVSGIARMTAQNAVSLVQTETATNDTYTNVINATSLLSTAIGQHIPANTIFYRMTVPANFADGTASVQWYNETAEAYQAISVTQYFIDTDSDGTTDYFAFYQPHELSSETYRVTATCIDCDGSEEIGDEGGSSGGGGGSVSSDPVVRVVQPSSGKLTGLFCPVDGSSGSFQVTLENVGTTLATVDLALEGVECQLSADSLSISPSGFASFQVEGCMCPDAYGQSIDGSIVVTAGASVLERIEVSLSSLRLDARTWVLIGFAGFLLFSIVAVILSLMRTR